MTRAPWGCAEKYISQEGFIFLLKLNCLLHKRVDSMDDLYKAITPCIIGTNNKVWAIEYTSLTTVMDYDPVERQFLGWVHPADNTIRDEVENILYQGKTYYTVHGKTNIFFKASVGEVLEQLSHKIRPGDLIKAPLYAGEFAVGAAKGKQRGYTVVYTPVTHTPIKRTPTMEIIQQKFFDAKNKKRKAQAAFEDEALSYPKKLKAIRSSSGLELLAKIAVKDKDVPPFDVMEDLTQSKFHLDFDEHHYKVNSAIVINLGATDWPIYYRGVCIVQIDISGFRQAVRAHYQKKYPNATFLPHGFTRQLFESLVRRSDTFPTTPQDCQNPFWFVSAAAKTRYAQGARLMYITSDHDPAEKIMQMCSSSVFGHDCKETYPMERYYTGSRPGVLTKTITYQGEFEYAKGKIALLTCVAANDVDQATMYVNFVGDYDIKTFNIKAKQVLGKSLE